MAEKKSNKEKTTEELLVELDQLFSESKPSPTPTIEIEQKADDIFDKVSSQQKINKFIDQYVVTDEFMQKVRRYARQEIDSAVLSALRSIAGVAIGTAIALLVTFLITGRFR
jgi:hypothetical protein